MYDIENKIEAIKEVQRLLSINKTSQYDDKTKKAVINHQIDNDLNPDGVTDYITFKSITNDYREGKKKEYVYSQLRFEPQFPYKYGDQGGDVGMINSLIRIIFTDYQSDDLLPMGDFYGRDTEGAVEKLRAIFMLDPSKEVDEALLYRMMNEQREINNRKIR